jgi:hypothetical protein
MSVEGLCEICERPDVEFTCDRCGKLVCDRHYDETRAACVVCVTEMGEGDERIPSEELPDGVDYYQF